MWNAVDWTRIGNRVDWAAVWETHAHIAKSTVLICVYSLVCEVSGVRCYLRCVVTDCLVWVAGVSVPPRELPLSHHQRVTGTASLTVTATATLTVIVIVIVTGTATVTEIERETATETATATLTATVIVIGIVTATATATENAVTATQTGTETGLLFAPFLVSVIAQWV